MSRRVALAAALAFLLAGCFTGERPYFGDSNAFPPGSMTGDAAIDAVLTKLDAAKAGPATAAYTVLTKYGNTTNPALVVLEPGRRSVTIGNTRYIQTDAAAVTCSQDGAAACINGFDLTRVSDIGITVDFYAADTAKRLRRDAQAKLGPAVPHEETFANEPASCVDVPVSGGTAVYCVLANGLLAKLDDGDVLVTLTMFGAVVDPNSFVIPG